MKGEAQKLLRFFDGADKRFVIPVYQRNYDWKESNCAQLFDDLVSLHESGRASHFFGSIVSWNSNDDGEERMIIDGQQRITTVSLILIAIVRAAKAGDIVCNDPTTLEKIWEQYLVDRFHKSERKVKLKPIKRDLEAFDALLFKDEEDYVKGSNITKNYYYFYRRIASCGLSAEDLHDAVRKLEVINIKLNAQDNPQLIFESLNSTGLDLSEADKIRNYLLMSLDEEEQEKFYEKYWNKIERDTDYNPTMFIRDYLTVQKNQIFRVEEIYFKFKNLLSSSGMSRTDVLEDMARYSTYYSQIVNASTGSKKVDRKITELNTIDSAVAMPFYMSFLDYAKSNGLSEQEVYEVFDSIENYWARRIICFLPSNALAKAFSTLHSEILKKIASYEKRGVELTASYSEILKFILLRKQGVGAFPRNEMVTEEFKTRQVYKMPAPHKYFLFERMENVSNTERHDVIKELKQDGSITIEHIMPQHLTDEWKSELGEEWSRIHEQYLHTFANLTLTGWNSSYSNRTFTEKLEGYIDKKGVKVYGFKDSAYQLNNYLKTCTCWTETEILERQKLLLDRFYSIWPMIESSFKPLEKETDTISLDDDNVDDEVVGRKIVAFSFMGEHHQVSSWVDMMLYVCRIVERNHWATMQYLCEKDNWFHLKPSNYTATISVGHFVQAGGNWGKVAALKLLLKECEIPYADLQFELVPTQEDNS